MANTPRSILAVAGNAPFAGNPFEVGITGTGSVVFSNAPNLTGAVTINTGSLAITPGPLTVNPGTSNPIYIGVNTATTTANFITLNNTTGGPSATGIQSGQLGGGTADDINIDAGNAGTIQLRTANSGSKTTRLTVNAVGTVTLSNPYLYFANGTGTVNSSGGPFIYSDANNTVLHLGSGNQNILFQNSSGTNYALFSSGGVVALNGYNFLQANAAGAATPCNQILDSAGNASIFLGGGGASPDPTNYYRNTNHRFGNIGGGTDYLFINASGVGLQTTTINARLQFDNAIAGTAGTANKIRLFDSGGVYGFGISAGSLDITTPGGTIGFYNGTTQVGAIASTGQFASTGATAGYIFSDRSTSGAGAIYRSAGVNRLWDNTKGDILTWNSSDTNVSITAGDLKFAGGSGHGQIGITDAGTANSGIVGEYTSAINNTGISILAGTVTNITSKNIGAGDWDVEGEVWLVAGTTFNAVIAAISTTSATFPSLPADGSGVAEIVATLGNTILAISRVRINVNTSTTVYLVAQPLGGNATGFGKLSFRRVH